VASGPSAHPCPLPPAPAAPPPEHVLGAPWYKADARVKAEGAEGPKPEGAVAQVPAQARQAEAPQAAREPQPAPAQVSQSEGSTQPSQVPQPELGEKPVFEWRRGSVRVRLHLGKSGGHLLIEKDRAVELEEDFERQYTQRVIQRAGIVLGDLAAEGALSGEEAAELKREIEERITEWAKRQLVIETPSGTITLEDLTWSEEDWENWRKRI